MTKNLFLFRALLLSAFVFSLGCQNGNCRSQKKIDDSAAIAVDSVNPLNKIQVFKYDGSLQCGTGKAIPIVEMQKELGTLIVYKAESKADGLMHVQMCGTNTGKANVYTIDSNRLEEARKLGFKQWTY